MPNNTECGTEAKPGAASAAARYGDSSRRAPASASRSPRAGALPPKSDRHCRRSARPQHRRRWKQKDNHAAGEVSRCLKSKCYRRGTRFPIATRSVLSSREPALTPPCTLSHRAIGDGFSPSSRVSQGHAVSAATLVRPGDGDTFPYGTMGSLRSVILGLPEPGWP
jgi:hypothetical protein